MKLSKRRRGILLWLYTATIILVLLGFLCVSHNRAETYKRYMESSYQHAFTELVTSMGEIDTALQKSLYATSPSLAASLCTDIFGKAMAAQMSLGELPYAGAELANTAGFISRVGDYAYVLSKTLAGGSSYTEEQLENLRALSDTATLLSENLIQLQADINSGAITIQDLTQAEENLSDAEKEAVAATLNDSLQVIESEFPEIPALIYDGPFSQHITQMTPRLIENEAEVTQEAARTAAGEFLGLREDVFTFVGERAGDLPVYLFSAWVDGGEMTVEVTRQGGRVLSVFSSRSAREATISPEDAVPIAADFLQRGYENMKESYYMVTGNVCLINFAYVQGDVICYSDLVKVSVALDTGTVVGFESLGYVMSHHQREIPAAEVSLEDAQAKVSADLEVLSSGQAVIPTEGKNELFCYEFICRTSDERHYILYVNAVTGAEEKILILIEDESGTLTL